MFRLILLDPERDVLGQLIELARLRAAVRADTEMDRDRVQVTWLCVRPLVSLYRRTAKRLEKHVLEPVVGLSRDTHLFSLAWSLGAAPERADLLWRTRERLPPVDHVRVRDRRFPRERSVMPGVRSGALTAGSRARVAARTTLVTTRFASTAAVISSLLRILLALFGEPAVDEEAFDGVAVVFGVA